MKLTHTIMKRGAMLKSAIALIAMLGVSAQAYALRYGAICNSNFDKMPNGKPWSNSFANGPATCNAFLSHMTPNSNAWIFNWGTEYGEIHALESAWSDWETNFTEASDIVFVLSHGNAQNPAFGNAYMGYNFWDTAGSKNMRLGTASGQRGLSVLSFLSCYTLTPYPTTPAQTDTTGTEPRFPSSYTFDYYVLEPIGTRWANAMRGGLRMITGSWQQMPMDRTDVMAGNYATYLVNGRTFEDAWETAAFDQSPLNTPAVFASGANLDDCDHRIATMNLSNFTTSSYPKYVDNQIGKYCWTASY